MVRNEESEARGVNVACDRADCWVDSVVLRTPATQFGQFGQQFPVVIPVAQRIEVPDSDDAGGIGETAGNGLLQPLHRPVGFGVGPFASDVARHGAGEFAGSFPTNSGENLAECSAISGGFLSPASHQPLFTIHQPQATSENRPLLDLRHRQRDLENHVKVDFFARHGIRLSLAVCYVQRNFLPFTF